LPGNKRERELARAKYERQQAKRNAQAARRRQRYLILTAVVVTVLVVTGFVVLANVLKGTGSPTNAAATLAAASSASGSPTPVAAVVPTDGTPALCAYRAGGTAARKVSMPSTSGPTAPATKTAKITLNGKVVTIQLLASKAPCTVNSFVHLAAAKFFDNTPCHRLTTGSLAVLQCGDPTGTGSSGPGYQYNDENLTGATYPAGTVAMANAGPNTNGSQFFLVYANSTLDASYTPFGEVVGGLDVLTAIAKNGVKGGGSDGAPAKPVTISTVVVGG
jgi:peptidyl-prolyl cis-trans isomerase B (cyclophilin B)